MHSHSAGKPHIPADDSGIPINRQFCSTACWKWASWVPDYITYITLIVLERGIYWQHKSRPSSQVHRSETRKATRGSICLENANGMEGFDHITQLKQINVSKRGSYMSRGLWSAVKHACPAGILHFYSGHSVKIMTMQWFCGSIV